jgi:hypothetical protein
VLIHTTVPSWYKWELMIFMAEINHKTFRSGGLNFILYESKYLS